MSGTISKIIPRNAKSLVSQATIIDAIAYLKSCVKANDIKAVFYDKIVFIDCGENLESIVCPVCGETLSFGWWGEHMDAAYKDDFDELAVELPCCGNNGSLNDLKYHGMCGFSRWVIEIHDSEAAVADELKGKLEKIFGEEIKEIQCRY